MILLVLFGYLFYRSAAKRNLSPWPWAIFGAGSYIIGQVLVGVVLGAMGSRLLYGDELTLMGLGFISGIIAVAITHIILQSVAKNKTKINKAVDDDLLDDRYLHKP